MITLSLLGEPTFRVNGDIVDIASRKGLALLAYLTVVGERQHRDIVATLLWPEHDQQSARTNLRRTLYRLRQTLAGEWIVVDRDHVGVKIGGERQIDVIDFREHLQAGRLSEAIDLYRGDFLTGFYVEDSSEFEEWALQQREVYRRQVLEALFELAQTAKEKKQYEAMVAHAQRQLDLDPLREQALRQLLIGLAYAGKRNEALAVYDRSCRLLLSELGVTPEVATVELFASIVAGELQTHDTTPPLFQQQHNLVAGTTPFLGRSEEVDELLLLLTQPQVRLVTIVAPGGMGKTRLAHAVAECFVLSSQEVETEVPFSDGVYWVDLAGVEEPESVLEAVGAAINIRFKPEAQEQRQQILDYLSRRKILLIMDNFEHLLARVEVIREILASARDVKILVTSRLPLNLLGETRLSLTGLDYPHDVSSEKAKETTAVQLFITTAQRMLPGFTLNERNVEDVVRICQLVEGMPLGIILASSWVEILEPDAIATEIEGGLGILITNLTDVPVRQRSMQAVLTYSWDLLTAEEQRVFSQLSVFRGGFTRAAAERVASAALSMLLDFTRRSLLQREPDDRYRIHELLRQFAEEHLRQSADAFTVYERHASYYAELAGDQYSGAWTLREPACIEVLDVEMDNLRQAWRYALQDELPEILITMTPPLYVWYDLMGRPLDGIERFRTAMTACRTFAHQVPEETMIVLCLSEAWLWNGIDLEISERLAWELLPELENHQPDYYLLRTYHLLYYAAEEVHDVSGMRAWAVKALEMAQVLEKDVAEVYWQTILLQIDELKLDRLQETLEGSMQVLRKLRRTNSQNYDLIDLANHIGWIHQRMAQPEEAVVYYQLALRIAMVWKQVYRISLALHALEDLHLSRGELTQSRNLIGEGLEAHLAFGQSWQLLGYIVGVCISRPELMGGMHQAVRYLSAAYHDPEIVHRHRLWIESELPQFKATMDEDAFAFAWEAGRKLDLKSTVKQLQDDLR